MKSKIKIKGKYKFNITFNVPLHGNIQLTTPIQTNKITPEGNEFIIRRLYNSTLDPINYIAIAPTQDLEKLKNTGSIVKKIEKTTVKPNGVEFSTSFTSTEIEEIQQISLTNKPITGIIITHSTLDQPFTKLPPGVTVKINYTLTLGDN
jgi:hypothetical protein